MATPGPSTQAIIRSLAAHAVRTWTTATAAEQARWVAQQALPPETLLPPDTSLRIKLYSRWAVDDAREAVRLGVVVPVDMPITEPVERA